MLGPPALVASALAAIDGWAFAERLASWAVIGAITGGITVAVMRQQVKGLLETVRDLGRTVASHERRLAEIRQERTDCELKSTREHATHAEVLRVITDQAEHWQSVGRRIDAASAKTSEQVGKVHERIDKLAEGVATMKGKLNAG